MDGYTMIVIKNVSSKTRYCEDKLIQAGEEVEVSDEKYVKAAKYSPEVFTVENKKESKKVREDK